MATKAKRPYNRMKEPKEGQMCVQCGEHPADTIIKKRALCPNCMNADAPGYREAERERMFSRGYGCFSEAAVSSRPRKVADQRTDTLVAHAALLLGS